MTYEMMVGHTATYDDLYQQYRTAMAPLLAAHGGGFRMRAATIHRMRLSPPPRSPSLPCLLSKPLLACVLLMCACSREAPTSEQHLQLVPVAFGGEHEDLLERGLGKLQAYRLRYAGPPARLGVVAEVIENGKVVATKSLFASELPPAADLLLGLIALQPHRDGQATELTCLLATDGSTLRGNAVLGEWDALAAPGEGTGIRAFNAVRMIDVRDGKPIVVWRWYRGGNVPADPQLTDAPPADVHSILQVTIRVG